MSNKRQRKKNRKRIGSPIRNHRRRFIAGAAASRIQYGSELLDLFWPSRPGKKSLRELGW